MSHAEYQLIVNRLVTGIETEPGALLEPLVERIREYARTARFEDAAELRDRHRALTRALEDRRNWEVLSRAGLLWAEDGAGDSILIENGRLLASWTAPGQPPLGASHAGPPPPHRVPDSVSLAEEARLLWRWLDRPDVRIIDTTRPLATPRLPVPVLSSLAG